METADFVFHSGEPVVVEEDGEPRIVLVPASDFEAFERFQQGRTRADDFSRRLARLAGTTNGDDATDDDIVEAVRKTRGAIYRERYSGA